MAVRVREYRNEDRTKILEISLQAWTPVFGAMEQAVPDFVYRAFYPDGWRARQTADIGAFLDAEADRVLVAEAEVGIAGWLGFRFHAEDRMGEISIVAVEPQYHRAGVAQTLTTAATLRLRDAGMVMIMVETGDDPGHAAARGFYVKAGFTRWPVARYFRRL